MLLFFVFGKNLQYYFLFLFFIYFSAELVHDDNHGEDEKLRFFHQKLSPSFSRRLIIASTFQMMNACYSSSSSAHQLFIAMSLQTKNK